MSLLGMPLERRAYVCSDARSARLPMAIETTAAIRPARR